MARRRRSGRTIHERMEAAGELPHYVRRGIVDVNRYLEKAEDSPKGRRRHCRMAVKAMVDLGIEAYSIPEDQWDKRTDARFEKTVNQLTDRLLNTCQFGKD